MEALETVARDVRLALRQFRQSPLFAAIASVSLALGIGANTAIFTFFDQVLVRPLPVRNPEQLVLLNWEGRRYGVTMGPDTLSYPMYADLRDKNDVFSDVFCRSYVALTVTFRQQSERADGELVSGNYFDALGVGAAVGRTFGPDDDRIAGGHPLAVLSYDADTEIVGVVRDAKYTNVRDAIRPQAFLNLDQHNDYQQVTMYVRTHAEPRQMYAAIRRTLQAIDSNVPPFAMRTMDEQRDVTLATDRLVASLALAFGLVATLLAAVGLYGLMAFTVAQRMREIGLRMALGARRGTVTWLVMKEVAALVGLGVAIALPASWALAGLVRSQLYGITPDDPASMAAAAFTLALVAAVAGWVPASRAARIDPMRALRCE